MNKAEQFNFIREEIDEHFKRIDNVIDDIKKWMPLKKSDFEDKIKISEIDSFIYRFAKIQDRIGSKFFPIVLDILGEYSENMAFIDILNRLEKLNLIESSDRWIDYRELRNQLTHEYPNDIDDIRAALLKAIEYYDNIKSIYKKIVVKILKYL